LKTRSYLFIFAFLLFCTAAVAQIMPPGGDESGEPLPSSPPGVHTIAWAKTLPDNTVLTDTLDDKVVTRTFPKMGHFYISESSRACGIKVESAACPYPGDTITVTTGTMNTTEGERFIDNASYTVSSHNTFLRPLGMTNKSVGGGDFWYDAGPPPTGQSGFWDGYGLNNVGLLIRTWGNVTEIGDSYFYIDDGSGVDMAVDLEVGSGKVIPFTNQIGDYLSGLTGICSRVEIEGVEVRVLRLCAPVLTLTRAVGQSSPANRSPVRFSATFTEPVIGFDDSDVVVTGGTEAHVTDSGDHRAYTIEVSGMTEAGAVGVSVAYGAADSMNAEKSLAASITISYVPSTKFRVINKRLGVGTGRFQRKPVK